jgi:glucose/arabinose dehydrogenase
MSILRVTPFVFGLLAACGADAQQHGAGASKDKPFATAEVATFNEPWAMTFLPGSGRAMTDNALVTEKSGKLKLVDTRTGKSVDVAGVPAVSYAGQGGLGDVIVHPDFAANQYVYLSWAEEENGVKGAAVGRARLVLGDAPRLEGLQVIWRQEPKVTGNGHFGHRLAFGPDGMLYISSGERQKFDPAQDMNANLGKIVRLTDTGMIPSDNPFYDQGRIKAQIWSMGHRNPLGLAFDAQGRLWNQEMGPRHGDELNLVKKGANYGYPRVSNGDHYDGRDIPDHSPGDGFEAPKVFWVPAISPAGLMIYSGNLFPAWKGDAFIGGLSGEALVRVDLDGESARKGDQWPMGARIREVEQGPDGAIWLLEDGDKGRLLKLTPRK